MALGIGANSDRFKATLRTRDAAMAAEWAAVLRSACGAMQEKRYARLHAAIELGDGAAAAEIATELSQLQSKVPHHMPDGDSARKSSGSKRAEPMVRTALSVDCARERARLAGRHSLPQTGFGEECNSDNEIIGTELPDPEEAGSPSFGSPAFATAMALSARLADADAALGRAHAALLLLADDVRAAAAYPPAQLAEVLASIAEQASAAAAAGAKPLRVTQVPSLDLSVVGFTSMGNSSVVSACASPDPDRSFASSVGASSVGGDGGGSGGASSLGARRAVAPESPEPRAPTEAAASSVAKAASSVAEAASSVAKAASSVAKAESTAASAAAHAADPRPFPGHLSSAGVDATTPLDKQWASEGDGTRFDLRVGPDYRRHKKKDKSAAHVYTFYAAEVPYIRQKHVHIQD